MVAFDGRQSDIQSDPIGADRQTAEEDGDVSESPVKEERQTPVRASSTAAASGQELPARRRARSGASFVTTRDEEIRRQLARGEDGRWESRWGECRSEAPVDWRRDDLAIVPDTGFETLSERLWEPLLSVAGSADPRRGLLNLRLLAQDEAGVDRATVAGVLLCAPSPQDWLPQATIMATQYRGLDRASGQLDAQEIGGPLLVEYRPFRA